MFAETKAENALSTDSEGRAFENWIPKSPFFGDVTSSWAFDTHRISGCDESINRKVTRDLIKVGMKWTAPRARDRGMMGPNPPVSSCISPVSNENMEFVQYNLCKPSCSQMSCVCLAQHYQSSSGGADLRFRGLVSRKREASCLSWGLWRVLGLKSQISMQPRATSLVQLQPRPLLICFTLSGHTVTRLNLPKEGLIDFWRQMASQPHRGMVM